MNWLRSRAYSDFFESLDNDGGFFYERWGDAPIHSIAAGLMLKKEEILFFNDIAYRHAPFTHCPTGDSHRLHLRCHCNPDDNFDWAGYSCKLRLVLLNSISRLTYRLGTSRYFDINEKERPDADEG